MVDSVYKKRLPELRNTLEKLREDFADLGSKTNWTKLRIDPLLRHLLSLEKLLDSPEFSEEFSHLPKGVEMFHSDLVYYTTNIKALKKILRSERGQMRKMSQD